jgi:hypothetical protein
MHPAKQAWYDSNIAADIRRRGCTPNTRIVVLSELLDWTRAAGGSKVYWMNGMAGTGKTTIAYSLCAELQRAQQLGASFFCSRTLPDCREATRIVPTIAYQLARFSSSFRSTLCRVLDNDPDIRTRGMLTQFERLIREPMLEANEAAGLVVVIDALDECTDRSGAQSILEILLRYAADLPIKFFVSSRPEPGFLNKMQPLDNRSRFVFHLHDIEQSLVQADIETYLNEELESCSLRQDQIKLLAQRAGSLFIYASTAVRYIRPDGVSVDSNRRFDLLLMSTSDPNSKAHTKIDVLYATVLAAALENEELETWEAHNIRVVLHTIVCALEPMTTEGLASLLKLGSSYAVQVALEPLLSVLYVSSSGGRVSTLHASFIDYMLSRERSGRFFCDHTKHSELLAFNCFEIMKALLRFNICNLESSFVFDADVPDLPNRINEAISPHLFYACRYWVDHTQSAEKSDRLTSSLDWFLSHQLLFWMEVLNLKHYIKQGARMLFAAYTWLQVSKYMSMTAIY